MGSCGRIKDGNGRLAQGEDLEGVFCGFEKGRRTGLEAVMKDACFA